MSKKKQESDLLPFLLGGVAAVAAGVVYKKYKESKEETTDDTWITDGGYSGFGGSGVGGSGDFYGNSSPVINPEYAPDSVANGVEDIPLQTVSYGLTDPSSGGVNPNNYGTDGIDLFSLGRDLITDPSVVTGLTGAAALGVSKGFNAAANKVLQKGTTAAVGTGTGRVAVNVGANAAKTAGALSGAAGAASTIGKGLLRASGVFLAFDGMNMALDAIGKKEEFYTGVATSPAPGLSAKGVHSGFNVGREVAQETITNIVNHFATSNNGIGTDAATTNEVGYVKEGVSEKTGNIYVKTDTPRYVKTEVKQVQTVHNAGNQSQTSATQTPSYRH